MMLLSFPTAPQFRPTVSRPGRMFNAKLRLEKSPSIQGIIGRRRQPHHHEEEGEEKRGVQHLPLRYEIVVVVVVIVLLLAAPLLFVARRPQIGSIMVKMHEEEEEGEDKGEVERMRKVCLVPTEEEIRREKTACRKPESSCWTRSCTVRSIRCQVVARLRDGNSVDFEKDLVQFRAPFQTIFHSYSRAGTGIPFNPEVCCISWINFQSILGVRLSPVAQKLPGQFLGQILLNHPVLLLLPIYSLPYRNMFLLPKVQATGCSECCTQLFKVICSRLRESHTGRKLTGSFAHLNTLK